MDTANHPRTGTLKERMAPRVLVVVGTAAASSRGILRGFMAAAQEHNWTLFHYRPPIDLPRVMHELSLDMAVLGPELGSAALAGLPPESLVSVPEDRSSAGIASVCLDEGAVGGLALEHMLGTGLRHVSTVRFDDSPFALSRERAFIASARCRGAKVAAGWGSEELQLAQGGEDPAAIMAWLRALPKPCGIFACTDFWARAVARYALIAGFRVPEDLALVGADNDALECELMAPPLSSVVIPWQGLGRIAAGLVQRALRGQAVAGERVLVAPLAVHARRSSDILAIDDALVAKAVRWIRANAHQRLTVPMVAGAVGGGRQRLERRFRGVLNRTVLEEVRRAHVEAAKQLLETSGAGLPEIARRSGFATAALLTAAFHREVGMPPGRYRRRMREARDSINE
jgi:LacI family transcriptional regulator